MLAGLMDAIHPWKCQRGHENRTAIAADVRRGPRRRILLRCAEPGCDGRTSIFVGGSIGAPPDAVPSKRRRAPRPE